MARETEGFSGAEIEQLIIAGLYDAFEAGRDLKEDDLLHNIAQAIPLSQTMREPVTALRNWARTHARPASTDPSAQRFKEFDAERGDLANSLDLHGRAVLPEGS